MDLATLAKVQELVRQAIDSGKTPEEMRNYLYRVGYSEEEVNQVLPASAAPQLPQRTISPPSAPAAKHFPILPMAVIALIVVLAGTYFLTRGSGPATQPVTPPAAGQPGAGQGATPGGQVPAQPAGQPAGKIQFYTPEYTPWGDVSDVCLSPLQLAEVDTFHNALKKIDGGTIVEDEDGDWQAGTPSVTVDNFDSFGDHVAYVLLKEASDMSWSRYELYYDGTNIYSGEKKVSVELFGDNILHLIYQDPGASNKQAVYNNDIDPMGGQMMTDYDSCFMSTDLIVCLQEGTSELYEYGTPIGKANGNFGLSQYLDNDAHISKHNFQWFDDNNHVQFLLLSGAENPPPNLGLNNMALQVISVDESGVNDLGETSYPFSPQVFGNHVAFLKCGYEEDSHYQQGEAKFSGTNLCHVIYDGKDLGPGEDPSLFGDHIAFTSTYCDHTSCSGPNCCMPVVVYDNKVIDVAKELGLDPKQELSIYNVRIFGSHIAYSFSYGGYSDGLVPHVAYDGRDMGAGHDIVLFGDHIAFYRDGSDDTYASNVIYDGRDMGPASTATLFGDHIAFLAGESDVHLDGNTYPEAQTNILSNMQKCRQYYLENEVPTSDFGQNPNFELKRFDA